MGTQLSLIAIMCKRESCSDGGTTTTSPSMGASNGAESADIEMAIQEKAPESSTIFGFSKKKRPRIVLEWRDVSLSVDLPPTTTWGTQDEKLPKTKEILKNLSGRVEPGQLLALMGPSGAGKTSLLNCLNGGNGKYTGEITLNGRPWSVSQKRCTAYVQQDDLFPQEITPREFLQIVASLRMDHGSTEEEKNEAIEGAIKTLGLSKCADTWIGEPAIMRGISGGERKRLSIASEILNDPSLIFLDEPTSGLDSFMAESVVQQLRDLASDPVRPRTIIATIHQPSSQTFALFDQLNLIADGRNAYFGPGIDSVAYFRTFGDACICPNHMNPADFFLALLSPLRNSDTIELVCSRYSPKTNTHGTDAASPLKLDEAVTFK